MYSTEIDKTRTNDFIQLNVQCIPSYSHVKQLRLYGNTNQSHVFIQTLLYFIILVR